MSFSALGLCVLVENYLLFVHVEMGYYQLNRNKLLEKPKIDIIMAVKR